MSDALQTTQPDSTTIEYRATDEIPRASPLPEVDAPPAPEPPKMSLRDAITKAHDESAKPEADAGKDAKPEAEAPKVEKQRATDGKFAKQEKPVEANEADGDESGDKPDAEAQGADGKSEANKRSGFRDETDEEYQRRRNAPSGFVSPKAKELWHQAPNEVKREVHRILDESQAKSAQYAEIERDHETLRPYRELAAQHGTTVDKALENYVGIEKMLKENPLAGIDQVLRNIGTNLPQFVQTLAQNPQILQQFQQQQFQPQQQAQQPQSDPRVAAMERQMEDMRIQQAQAMIIEPFRAQAPRFDELQGDIAFFLNSGKIPATVSPHERLEIAYEMAERLNPAPYSQRQAPSRDLADDAADVREKPVDNSGTLSIKGAPSGGRSGSTAPRPKSRREAIDAALSQDY